MAGCGALATAAGTRRSGRSRLEACAGIAAPARTTVTSCCSGRPHVRTAHGSPTLLGVGFGCVPSAPDSAPCFLAASRASEEATSVCCSALASASWRPERGVQPSPSWSRWRTLGCARGSRTPVWYRRRVPRRCGGLVLPLVAIACLAVWVGGGGFRLALQPAFLGAPQPHRSLARSVPPRGTSWTGAVGGLGSTGRAVGPAERDAEFLPAEIAPSPFGVLPGARRIAKELQQPYAVLFEFFIVPVVCFLYVLQTLPLDPSSEKALSSAEDAVQIVFIVEYLLRWYSRNLRPTYLLKFSMIVDLVAFLPFLLVLAGNVVAELSFSFQFLRLFRVLRLQRFFRDRSSFARLVGAANADAVKPFELQLARTINTVFTLVFISSGLVYNAEHDVNPDFSSFFATIYFGLVTLTTVGYGDMAPITPEGRVVVCLSILAGVATIPVELSKLAGSLLDSIGEGDSSGEKLLAVNEKLERQQAQLDAIAKRLGVADEAAFQGPTAKSGSTEPRRSPSRRACGSCGAVGHPEGARFCFNCGAALHPQLAEVVADAAATGPADRRRSVV